MLPILQLIIDLPLKILAYLCFEFRQKDKTSIIFCSYQNTSYNFNSKYLFEYLHQNGYKCTFVLDNKKLRTQLNRVYENSFVSSRSLNGLKKILLANVWITSTGMPIRIPYAARKRTVINLWHGVPLKKIGRLEHNIEAKRKYILNYIYKNNYTVICVTSENLRQIYAKSFLCDEKTIRVFGQPQNDQLFSKSYEDTRLDFEKLSGVRPLLKHNILYCPTYRTNKKNLLFPFPNVDLKKLNNYLGKNNITLFIRQHPLDKTLDIHPAIGHIKHLSEDVIPDVMQVLGAFDLLITDYSSLYIDFLLLNRPIIFLPYDLEEYSKSRGLNFQYSKVTPGPKPKTQRSFENEIHKLLTDSSYYLSERILARDYFHQVFGTSNLLIREYIDSRIDG